MTGWGSGEWGHSSFGIGYLDETPPTLANIDPASLELVGPAHYVRFDILDAGTGQSGVNLSSVQIHVNGDLAYSGATDSFEPGYDGSHSTRTAITGGHRFCIQKTDFFAEGYQTVAVYAEDNDGNVLNTSWQFIVSLAIPKSDEFRSMDVIGPDLAPLLVYREVSSSRGAPYIFYNDGTTDIELYSDDGLPTTVYVDLATTSTHTFEIQFKPAQLPRNLENLSSSRFWVGANDEQGKSSGVLLSLAGLAFASDISHPVIPIPGSQSLFSSPTEYYTLRYVLDGETGISYVFITRTADLSITGHVLRFTTGAPDTPPSSFMGFFLDIVGQPDWPVIAKLQTLRFDGSAEVFPNRLPIADAGTDQTTTVGSSVIHDGSASYDPDGGVITYAWSLIEAPTGSRFKLTGSDGSTADDYGDGFTDIFHTSSAAFSEDNAPLLQPGDTLVVDGIAYTVAVGDSPAWWIKYAGEAKYTRNPAVWDDTQLLVTKKELPAGLSDKSWLLLHGNTYFSDQYSVDPYCIPDTSGLYSVQLVVNDGQLDSLPATAYLNVASTATYLGSVPDVSFIWDHLSDFWRQVDDRDKIETVWTGFAQAAAAQLLTAWQIDYNKSLLDIQRVFQRRWLPYSTLLNDTSYDASINIVRGPIYSVDLSDGAEIGGLTLEIFLDNGSLKTVYFTVVTPTPGRPANWLPLESSNYSNPGIVEHVNLALGMAAAEELIAKKVTDGGDAYLVLDYPTLLRIRPAGTANSLLGFSTTAYIQNDLCGAAGSRGTSLYGFDIALPPAISLLAEGVTSENILVVPGGTYRISEARSRSVTVSEELPIGTYPWAVPSFLTSGTLDFSENLVQAGDLVRFDVKSLSTGVLTTVLCTVVGVHGYKLGFDPAPLLSFYDGNTEDFSTYFVGIKRATRIPVDDLVVGVPRLQATLEEDAAHYVENTAYQIQVVGEDKFIVFETLLFSLTNPPPDTLWAEVTYLDNRPTIEANFGSLVDFSVEDLLNNTDDIDYLSAVRGLWYAYFGGPSINKVRIGTQILLGLPFAEEKGTVEVITEDFSLSEGRLLLRDVNDDTVVRSYFYSKKAGLAINRLTGLTIAVGDVIERFEPLSGGIEILDYVNNPDWITGYISEGFFSEVEKYFKFLFRGDVDTFNPTNIIFAIDFIKKIKPHYTFPLYTFLKKPPTDVIDVTDTVEMSAVMTVKTAANNFVGAYRWDDEDGAGLIRHYYDETPPRFIFDQPIGFPSQYITATLKQDLGTGPWEYDSIWAYDDSGGTDLVPLSGPAGMPPDPYGPPVGVVEYDATKLAGVYTRVREL